MNIGEANAVNVVVRALAGIEHPLLGGMPTRDEKQAAVDVLLRGSYKALAAGLKPGDVTIEEASC